jgi:hypothetical protein
MQPPKGAGWSISRTRISATRAGMGEGENDSPSEVWGTYLFLLRDGSRPSRSLRRPSGVGPDNQAIRLLRGRRISGGYRHHRSTTSWLASGHTSFGNPSELKACIDVRVFAARQGGTSGQVRGLLPSSVGDTSAGGTGHHRSTTSWVALSERLSLFWDSVQAEGMHQTSVTTRTARVSEGYPTPQIHDIMALEP